MIRNGFEVKIEKECDKYILIVKANFNSFPIHMPAMTLDELNEIAKTISNYKER